MKKLLFSLVVACMTLIGSEAYAQSETQSATLQQKDKTTVYYGPTAFVDAFNAVKDSADVITLSSGTFLSTTVNKPVTIYGAGFELNEENGIYPTIINDFVVAHISTTDPKNPSIQTQNNIDGIHIEGVRINYLQFGYNTKIVTLSNLVLKKCYFGKLAFEKRNEYEDGNANTTNTKVINCVINTFYVDTSSNNFGVCNSIINNLIGRDQPNSLFVKNSIIFKMDNVYGTFKDNIMLPPGAIGGIGLSSYYERNIARSSTLFDYLSDANKKDNWVGKTDIAIFGETIGDAYNPQLTYAIKADAAKTYIGTDGTPVGLYGGFYPFTKTPSTPQIVSKAIDVQSTTDGKLKVNIKVEAQTEAPAQPVAQ